MLPVQTLYCFDSSLTPGAMLLRVPNKKRGNVQRNNRALLTPLALLFMFAGWKSLESAAHNSCSLEIGWAQLGIPSPACPENGCSPESCKMQQLDWTDGNGVDHSLHVCGCGESLSPAACLGWLEIVYSEPITVNGGCLFPEKCPNIGQECAILQVEDWPIRPDPRRPLCICADPS